MHKGE
jgi:hypothetical protein